MSDHQREDIYTPPQAMFRAVARFDKLSPELRECAREFGLEIVHSFMECGVTKPARIRYLVNIVRLGSRSTGQVSNARNQIDALLWQSGSSFTFWTFKRALRMLNWAIVPIGATQKMIEASMATVSGFSETCSKKEKHLRRLSAALLASHDEDY